MALVKFGNGIASLSGKIDGTVFARNRAGAYARGWSKPVNPETPYQSEAKSLLTNASNQWQALEPADQAAWKAAAESFTVPNRLGDQIHLSGQQYFIQVRINAALAGDTALVASPVPPLAPVFPDEVSTEFVADSTDTHWILGYDALTDDVLFEETSGPLSPGVSFVGSRLRLVRVSKLTSPIDTGDPTTDLNPALLTRFGTIADMIGRAMFGCLRKYSNGLLSPRVIRRQIFTT